MAETTQRTKPTTYDTMRQITIQLSEATLLKQLAKISYTIGENMGDDEAKMRHFIQGMTDEGHLDIILDRMDEAWADILKTVTAYTIRNPRYPCGAQEACTCTNWGDEDTTETANDGSRKVRYTVVLYFPINTFPDLGNELVTLFSRYITLNAKAEWQAITRQTHSIGRGYGQDYTISEAQAIKVLAKIKSVISMRTTNARLKQYKY